MTPPNVKRHLRCEECENRWQITVGDENDFCPKCGYLGEGLCACDCGATLADLRSDAVYRSEACAKRLQRRGTPDIDPTGHPLDEARGQIEEGRTSAQWGLVTREHIMRTLLETGWFTADDLEPIGVPQHYRRHVHGSETGYFSGSKGYMEFVGRRKSERPSRKGGKNDVFRITAKGRAQLPSLLRDLHTQLQPLVGSSNGAFGGTGVAIARSDQEQEIVGSTAAAEALTGPRDRRSGRSGDQSGVGNTPVTTKSEEAPPPNLAADSGSPGLLQLDVPHKGSSMYDPMEDAA